MAGPSNAGRKDGAEFSTERGRGSSAGRGGFFRSREPGARDSRGRGRGRGDSPAVRAGRGRGTRWADSASGNGSRNESKKPVHVSPFAPLRGSRQFSPLFGGQTGRQKGGTFGKPSDFNAMPANSDKTPKWRPQTARARPTDSVNRDSVPVEDASTLNRYNERYEQVGCSP